jgi:hypothetical protein
MCEKIEINRNGNKIEIIPDFEKNGIRTFINGEQHILMELNRKNQWVNTYKKIGVQLTEEQAEQIRTWNKTFDEKIEEENEAKRAEIKNQPVKQLSFKYGNYLMEKYIHTENVQINGEYVYSDEGNEIRDALFSLSLEELDKLGIERIEGIWQEIILTDEMKKFILERGAINQVETRKEMEKIEKVKTERKEKREQEAERKKAETLEKAVKTGEKQLLNTSSALADDGNLILIYKYIYPDGKIKTEEFYDGD